MTKEYSVGDLVELKSGSPDMTVTAVFNEGVSVAWCGGDESGLMHQTELPFGAVQHVQPATPRQDDRPPSPFAISSGGHRRQPINYDGDDIPF